MKHKFLSGKITIFIFLLVLSGFFCSSVLAQPSYIYKWLQPYDLANGIDIPSYYDDVPGTSGIYHVLADDWECIDDRPVTDIHWWGSYWEIDAAGNRIPYVDETDPYAAMGTSPQFVVNIHKDIPADPDNGIMYSRPGEIVWTNPTAFMGFFEGHEQNPIMEGASKFAWHWILDECDWFRQDPGANVYWLSIHQVFRDNDRYLWGWETSDKYWNDDAVVWNGDFYEPIGREVGLAFGLTTVPVPGAAWLLASGLLGIVGIRRFRRR